MKNLTLTLIIAFIIACFIVRFIPDVKAQTSGQVQLVADVELRGVGANGKTRDDCQQVTFIFRASYTGNIGGVAFTSADVPLTVRADNGNVLRQIPYTVTAGSLVVISTHN